MKDKEKVLRTIILIFLAVNLIVSSVLFVFFIQKSNTLEKENKSIQKQLDKLEDVKGEDQTAQFNLMIGLFKGEIEDKVDSITNQISDEIAGIESKVDEITNDISDKISGVESSFAEYDDEIKNIESSLLELNESMKTVTGVLDSIQEILDAIKKPFGIE